MTETALPGFTAPYYLTGHLSPEEIAHLAGLQGLVSPTQIPVLVDSSPVCVYPECNGSKREPGWCFMGSRGIEY